MTNEIDCPCSSGKSYRDCCRKYHDGEAAPSAEALMRSRFSAYALGKTDYIIETTHPDQKGSDVQKWKKELEDFSARTTFRKLDVRDAKEAGDLAFVTFIAYLDQEGRDATFTEESRFEKVEGKWLYHSGQVFSGEHLL